MRMSFRAAVIVGLLALVPLFTRSAEAAGPTTKIVLDPATVSLTSGQTQTFKVLAYAADNTFVDVTDQSVLSTDDTLGSISGATYTAGKVGSRNVQAAFQSFTTSAAVTVSAGAVQELVINPNSDPEPATIGTNVKFTATAYDAKNNIVSGQTIAWSVIGENGTIDSRGIFVPKKIGTGKIQAAIGQVIGQISVVVSEPIVTNTNTVVTNTVKNTNAVSNANTNTTTNTAVTNDNDTTTDCTTLKPWLWTLLLIVFLLAVAVLYALVPVMKIWPAAAALVLAAVLAIIQRKYDCNGQAWWAWIVMLGTLALTAVAVQMRPKNSPTV